MLDRTRVLAGSRNTLAVLLRADSLPVATPHLPTAARYISQPGTRVAATSSCNGTCSCRPCFLVMCVD